MLVQIAGRSDPKVAKVHTTIVTPGLADLVHHFTVRELNVLVIGTIRTQYQSGRSNATRSAIVTDGQGVASDEPLFCLLRR